MSDLDLAAIKARCAAATPGPWRLSRSEGIICGDDMYLIDGGGIAPSDAEFIAAARTDVPDLVAEVERLTAQKDNAYNERDRCVSVIACLARALGWPVWLATHEGDPWDDDWRNIVFIETPHGQVSWHYHDSERPMFSWIGLGMPTPKPWDGHSTPEKYNLLFGLVHDGIPNVQAEVARLRSDLASCYRITGADPDGDDDAMLATKAVNAVRRLREESDHQGTRADEFAEEVKKMAGERDAAHAAIELIKTDRRFAQENADGYRVRLGIVMRENDTFAETVKKLRDDLAEAAGVNAANLNTLRSVRERVAELEAAAASINRTHDAYGYPEKLSEWREYEAGIEALHALLAKGGAA